MIGRTVLHYRIVDKIGSGGMGEVYLAEDLHLDRKVALKFLPENLESDPVAGKRFLREAKSAAGLDHPFICKIYENRRIEGRTFIAMEYVSGPTLKQRIEVEAPFDVREALRIGGEICEALEAAHKQNTVHRDLKPSNIMLTEDGHIKVMDFGLAKRLESGIGSKGLKEGTTLTGHGLIAGTLLYMSPEQIRGEQADTRADIFTFGLLLYEMLSGVNPFKKESSIETAAFILKTDPPPLTDYRKDVPRRLQKIIAKMMAKEPSDRYSSAQEVRGALSAEWEQAGSSPGRPSFAGRPIGGLGVSGLWKWGLAFVAVILLAFVSYWALDAFQASGLSSKPIGSIAVLPFKSHSAEGDQEYFTDGMTDALITNLAQISALRVISQSSVNSYKVNPKPPTEIARELGVDALVEASVTRLENTLEVNARLIDGSDGSVLWSRQFSQQFQDVFNLQRQVAQAIAAEIDIELTVQEQARLSRLQPVNANLFLTYLRGNYHLNTRNREGLGRANQYFKHAIEIDAGFAPAYAGRADTYLLLGYYGFEDPTESFRIAEAAAGKALELDDQLADVHATVGLIRFLKDWEWRESEQSFRRAIGLNPSYGRAYQWLGLFLSATKRHDDAIQMMQTARKLDPLNPFVGSQEGVALHLAGRYPEAIDVYEQTLQMAPDDHFTHSYLAYCHLELGQIKKAEEHVYAALRTGRDAQVVAALGNLRAAQGNRQESLRLIEELDDLSPYYHAHDFRKATILSRLGQIDEALSLLEEAYQHRDHNLVYLAVDPAFKLLYGEGRFQALLKQLQLGQAEDLAETR